MADVTLTFLEELLAKIKDTNLQSFVEAMKAAGKSVVDIAEVSKHAGPDIQKMLGSMVSGAKDAIVGLSELQKQFANLTEAGSEAWTHLVGSLKEFKDAEDLAADGLGNFAVQGALALEPLIKIIPDAITGIGNISAAGYDAGSKLDGAFSHTKSILERTFGKDSMLVNYMESVSKGATQAYTLERSIISLAAAQGNFSSMLDQAGGQFRDMDQEYMDMTNLAYESAKATGQTVESMMGLAQVLGSIPDSLTEPISVAGDSMSQLAATSKLATGFMLPQADVAKHLGNMYTELGVSGQEAFESLANIYEKAGDSKLRFEAFTNTVMSIAQSFKMLGDNTMAATNVVKAFDEAFKGSKISPAAMQSVIQGMTEGIMGMDRAKQAFVSSQTGGPGGLAGAFQMEFALQEGKMDEVLKKTMTAMQAQFGGQVLTLKDAAQNPAMAGEFYKQVQYLTQVAGVAKTDREAYKILEAMQSGVMDNLQPGAAQEDSQKALENAVDRGTALQDKTATGVMRIHQDMEYARLIQNNTLKHVSEQTKELFGIHLDLKGNSGTTGIKSMAKPGGGREIVSKDRSASIDEWMDSFGQSGVGRFIEPVVGMGQTLLSGMGIGTDMGAPGGGGGAAPPPLPPPGGTGTGAPRRRFSGTGDVAPGTSRLPPALGVAGGGAGGGGGAFPTLPLSFSSDPVEITVNFTEPFEKKVKTIVNQQIRQSKKGEIRGGAGGNATP